MITGVHAIVYSPAADEVRAFFRDKLNLPNVDAGGGWLIFALPPAELAVHPAEQPSQELYLMCDDLDSTIAGLDQEGVRLSQPITEADWGRVAAVALPGGSELALYEPRHPSPLMKPTNKTGK